MAEIPFDIQEMITQVDRKANAYLLPRSDLSNTKYDNILAKAFPDCQVVNITEFDFGRSYRYLLVASSNPDAASLDSNRILKAVRCDGPVDIINMAISYLLPYVLIGYTRLSEKDGKLEQINSNNALSQHQEKMTVALLKVLSQVKLLRLPSEIAQLPVPDVETELSDKGHATVADCLFYG